MNIEKLNYGIELRNTIKNLENHIRNINTLPQEEIVTRYFPPFEGYFYKENLPVEMVKRHKLEVLEYLETEITRLKSELEKL